MGPSMIVRSNYSFAMWTQSLAYMFGGFDFSKYAVILCTYMDFGACNLASGI
jgi:hypothetical protein